MKNKNIFNIFNITFLKFIGVGVINTLFGASIMFTMYNVLHFSYWFSSVANYVFGSILSFFLNKKFTFNNDEKSIRIVIKFVINILFCYLIAYGIAKPLIKYLMTNSSSHIQDNVSMFVGMVLFLFLNYFGQRFWTFKKSTQRYKGV